MRDSAEADQSSLDQELYLSLHTGHTESLTTERQTRWKHTGGTALLVLRAE